MWLRYTSIFLLRYYATCISKQSNRTIQLCVTEKVFPLHTQYTFIIKIVPTTFLSQKQHYWKIVTNSFFIFQKKYFPIILFKMFTSLWSNFQNRWHFYFTRSSLFLAFTKQECNPCCFLWNGIFKSYFENYSKIVFNLVFSETQHKKSWLEMDPFQMVWFGLFQTHTHKKISPVLSDCLVKPMINSIKSPWMCSVPLTSMGATHFSISQEVTGTTWLDFQRTEFLKLPLSWKNSI